jgi:hypothetical protein
VVSYGAVMGTEASDELTWTEIADRLAREPFWWLATSSPQTGPHSVPVWGVVVDGVAYSYADAGARRMRDLREDPRAVLHLPSALDVLVVSGTLSDVGAAEQYPEVVAAYARAYPDPGDRPWLPGTEHMLGVRLLRLHPVRARAWRLDDFFGSQRRWRVA